MASKLLYLDATGKPSDPSSTNLKYLQRHVDEDGSISAIWAAPDSEHEYYDLSNGWSVPQFAPPLPPLPQTSEELNALSWEEIAALSAAAAKDPEPFLFMVDQDHKLEKDVDLSAVGCSANCKARIIGVCHDHDEEGNIIGLSFQMRDGLSISKPAIMIMTSSGYATGGWEVCEMRTTNLPKLKDALPEDLRPLLKKVKRKTNMDMSSGEPKETIDELALLSYAEVFGDAQGYASDGSHNWLKNEGTWYEWYKNHNTNEDRIIRGESGSVDIWWLRSAHSSVSFCFVDRDGSWYWGAGSAAYRPCFGFCV